MANLQIKVTIALLLALCSLPASAPAAGPTRDDFFREMLIPGQTEKTALFNAYYENAFRIDKLQLLDSFPPFAQKAGQSLRGFIVLGPIGMLWTYHVITFLREAQRVRCNTMVIPHARITGKSTAVFSAKEIGEFLEKLQGHRLLVDRGNSGEQIAGHFGTKEGPELEYEFNAMIVDLAKDGQRVRIGKLFQPTNERESQSFLDMINRLLQKSWPTYEHGKKLQADRSQ